MGAFVEFMQSTAGRTLRIVAGLALIGVGWFVVSGMWGLIVALVRFVPVLAGMERICLLAPLFGYTLNGERRVRHPAQTSVMLP